VAGAGRVDAVDGEPGVLDVTVKVLQGHVLDVLAELPPKSVHVVVTSPPYWGLRAYGTPPQVWGAAEGCECEWGDEGVKSRRGTQVGANAQCGNTQKRVCPPNLPTGAYCTKCGAWRGELGSEPTLDLFVAHLVEVFAAVSRVLRDDGTLWVNLGDSYASKPNSNKTDRASQGNGSGVFHVPAQRNFDARWAASQAKPAFARSGLRDGDLCMAPARFALAMQAAGWRLRSEITLCKTAPMPESVQGARWERCRVRTGRVPVAEYEKRGVQVPAAWDVGQHSHDKTPGGRYDTAEKTLQEWDDCPGCPRCEATDGLVQRWGSGRPTSGVEKVYVFAKGSGHYYWDQEAARAFQAWNDRGEQVKYSDDFSHAADVQRLSARPSANGLLHAEAGGHGEVLQGVPDRPGASLSGLGAGAGEAQGLRAAAGGQSPERGERQSLLPREQGDGAAEDGGIPSPSRYPRTAVGVSGSVSIPVGYSGAAPSLAEVGSRSSVGAALSDPSGAAGVSAPVSSDGQGDRPQPTLPQDGEGAGNLAPRLGQAAGASGGSSGHRGDPDGRRVAGHQAGFWDGLPVLRSDRPAADAGSRPAPEPGRPARQGERGSGVRELQQPEGEPAATRNLLNWLYWRPQALKAAHYAAYPRWLPRLAIQAGTSERGCCPKCGSPWLRVVAPTEAYRRLLESQRGSEAYSATRRAEAVNIGNGLTDAVGKQATREMRTLGWRQSCRCAPHEPAPCTALDPFSGSGTTVIEANALGRHGIGVELQSKYVDISHQRLAGQPLSLFAQEAAG
jgi:DNA modification methylase